jgi:FHS family L-fucose permease-like MFS transporter
MAKKNYSAAFALLTTLFFTWGFITVLVDSLIPRIKDLFTLNYFQAGLVQFAFFTAYLVLSIPSGWLLTKVGYKKGIIIGLVTMAVGCFMFYPAADFRQFWIFLLAYFVLAGGMTILQVAANPYVTVLGDPQAASSRLNLAQGFNSLGTAIAPIIGANFLLSDSIMSQEQIEALSTEEQSQYLLQEASAVQMPFVILAAIILGIGLIFLMVKLPQIMNSETNNGYLKALKNPTLLLGALGILVYVGAEVAIGSYLVNYFLSMGLDQTIPQTPWMKNIAQFIFTLFGNDIADLDKKAIVGVFVFFYWTGAMIGRFIGAYLTRIFKPSLVLATFAGLALTMVILSMSTQGLTAMWSILSVGLFNSIMFPTIFSLAIRDSKELKPQASGILCTMIVGGAIIPPLYGYFTDIVGFKQAFILILLCYAYILFFGYKTSKSN